MPDSQRPDQDSWPEQLECDAVRSSHWESVQNRPQAEPISVASVWQMESPETADRALAGETGAYAYRRDGHPNDRSLATKLAALHGCGRSLITAQGMSAISAVCLALLKPGAKAWVGHELYGKSLKLFESDMRRWGVESTTFDPTDPEDIDRIGRGSCDLVLAETISNPRLGVADLRTLAQATHRAGGLLCIDNTFATHLLCRPTDLGADLVVESLSKQVNGHSDSMLGLIVGPNSSHLDLIQDVITTFGMASSPLDCFLTHRGLSTLAVRMERACENALRLATALDELERVLRVDYPGLTHHSSFQQAKGMLTGGFGWMLTFHTEFDRDGVLRLFDQLRPEIAFVPSLGDVSTTVSHPASTSHRGMTVQQRAELGITEGTIRISCGIEPTGWVVDRFVKAIQAVSSPT